MPDIVYLVHGTFSPNAEWIEPNSPLAVRIKESLPQNSAVHKFVWDGRNSFRSRREAANHLSDQINNFLDTYASGKVHIVAHSHGGNIALLAVQQIVQNDRIASLCTIGTPFIFLKIKPWATPSFIATSLSIWTFFLTIIFLNAISLKGIPAYLLMYSVPVYCWRFIRKKSESIIDRAYQMVEKQSITAVPLQVPMLCIRYSFDEARIWLLLISFVRFVEYVLGKLYLLLRGDGVWKRAFKVLFISLVIAIVISATEMLIRVPLISWFFTTLFLLLAILPILSALGSAITSHKFGLAGSLSSAALLVQIGISAKPTSVNHKAEKFSAIFGFFRARKKTPGIFPSPHSLGYIDPAAIEAVGKFIKINITQKTEREYNSAK